MLRRARSLPLALAIAGIVAWWPAPGIAQDRREIYYCAQWRPEKSVDGLPGAIRLLHEAVRPKERRRDGSIRRLHLRIKQNENLQGGYYRFQANRRQLTESDLERGKSELRRMLRDRPEMARDLTEEDELFQWAVRKFAGEDVAKGIHWLPSDHSQLSDGLSRGGIHGWPGEVFIRDCHGQVSYMPPGTPKSFEELWSCLAFEVHNVQDYDTSARISVQAIVGEISRHDYVLGKARKEYATCLRTRLFYLEVYEPWARSRNIATDARFWRLDIPHTFEKWIGRYPSDSYYPWKAYGDQYDQLAPVWVNSGNVGRRRRSPSTESLKREQLQQLWNKIAAGPATSSIVSKRGDRQGHE